MSNLTILQTSKSAVLSGLDNCMSKYSVAALMQKHDQRVMYDYVSSSKEIILDYQATVLSPKKFFFPPEEVILEYTPDGKISPKTNVKPTVLFGIRPCDINAIKILDEAFSESNGDPNYMEKRENSVVIGIDCKTVCDQDAFCYKVKAQNVSSGCDLLLHPTGDNFTISVYTEKGKLFAEKYLAVKNGSKEALDAFTKEKEAGFAKYKPFKDLNDLPKIFNQNKKHAVWKKEGEKCLSCGSCIMGCPTCYCFDVVDELALNLKKGERIRRWDACVLTPFAEVHGGENFRGQKENRLHHRISRKFNYLMKKHGQSVCVGCGRCVRACLADINPKNIVEALTGETV